MILNIYYFGLIAEKISCENEKITVEKSILLSDFKIDLAKKYPALKNADCKDELTQFVSTEVNRQYPNLLELNDVNFLLN